MHEVLPVGGTENHAQFSGTIEDFIGTKVASADRTQHAVELIDRKDGRRRIVDGRREGLERDVDGDPKRKGGVLVQRAFRAERDQAAQSVLIDSAGATKEIE